VFLKKLHGVHVPHRKNTADSVPQRLPVPAWVTIPMSMHIGAPARPVVKPGDTVKVGQLIAEAGGFVSAPIYASVSGKVKKLEDVLLSNGQFVPGITIESDGKQEIWEGIRPPVIEDLEGFLAAVRDSGVVGLGGAGFPTVVKLTVKDLSKAEVLIINGAECEPYITSDTRTMVDNTERVLEGIGLVQNYLGVKRVIIGIENNKPQCLAAFRQKLPAGSSIELKSLPSLYPQGGEKVLIYNTTGKIVPEGKLPIDAGAIVMNCTTAAAIAGFAATGMPLVEKCITVDGSAIKEPKNVIVPIGTPLKDVFAFCGGFRKEPRKVIYGGPMMGIAVPNLEVPILKNTNAVLALDEKEAVPPKETACIKCGRCISHCPMGLMPAEIERAYRLKLPEELGRLKVNLCMECGCCSFVCPAKRPLVQINKLAKTVLREDQLQKKKAAEQAAAKEKEKEAGK
jgi:electron transport complex protein RnfC